VQRQFELGAMAAYVANRQGEIEERDRRLNESASQNVYAGDVAALRLLALRMRSNAWKSWKRPQVESESVLGGVGPLIDAREAWFAGNLDAARAHLRRARAEAVDGTGFREEAELLSAELGGPYTVLVPDPPYPNVLRYLAIFDLRR